MAKRIVVLTGAGVSAESGLKTFRDNDGLWNDHRVEDVATPEAWAADMELVLRFYNERRKQLMECKPNPAHYAIAELEKKFDVHVITQNVDDLHERAGSTNVIHLHGELKKVRSTIDATLVFDLEGWELKAGDLCPKGSQLRPHIVWFGEPVPNIIKAAEVVTTAEILLVVGTSMKVYPAAGLVHYAPVDCKKYYVDPAAAEQAMVDNLEVIREKAGIALPVLVKELMKG
jgi:NAD-dependent deacetylase